MLERDIEQLLRRRIAETCPRALCLKFISPGFVGVPDRVILLPHGYAIFAELKRPGAKERPRQRYVQFLLRKLGFTVFGCVDSVERVEAVVALCKELMWDA